MDTATLKPIKGIDVAIKVDFFGNQEVYITKIKMEGLNNVYSNTENKEG